MALSKKEWKCRVDAALAVRGEELGDLKQPVNDKGLPVNAAARAGHESDSYAPNHALALVVAELTEFPVAWFEADDWRPVLSEGAAAVESQSDDLGKLKAERSALLSTISQVRSEIEDLRTQKLRPESD
jgi:hypothetical protein